MRRLNRSMLMFLAGALASPMVSLGQVPAVPAVPEPAQQPERDAQIQIEAAAAARADAERAAQAAAMDAQGQAVRVFADANGNPRVAYWASRAGKKEKAAFLGVTATPADPALRDQLKLPRGIGLVIQTVGDDTPAAAAGVQEHDVFTKLDDQWLIGQNQLGVLIRMHKAGDEITLTGLRQGSPITLKAKLAEKELVISDTDGSVVPGVNAFGWNGQVNVPDMQPLIAERLAPLMADDEDANLIIKENDQKLKVSLKDGQRRLVATDNNNQVLFDGPVETEEQRKALPADIAEKLTKYKEQFDQVKEAGPGNKVRIIKDNR